MVEVKKEELSLTEKEQMFKDKWGDLINQGSFRQFSKAGEKADTTTRDGLVERFTRKEITDWLTKPDENSESLRNLSRYLYVTSSEYYQPINYYTNLLQLDYVLVPRFQEYEVADLEKIQKSKLKVRDYCDSILAKPVLRNIIKATLKDGTYFGYERKNGRDYYLQRLPNSHCRDGVIVNGLPAVQFNFEFFDTNEELLELYDKEFTTKYNAYTNGNEDKWQLLDVNKAVCIPMESEDFNFPAMAGSFTNLYDLDEYYKFMREAIEIEVAKIIVQTAPMGDDGDILVDPDELMFFQNVLSEMLEKKYKVVSTPFEIDTINFTEGKGNNAGFTGVDTMDKKTMQGTGVSPVTYGNTDSATGLKFNHSANVSYVFSIVEKIEMWVNTRLQKISSNKFRFRVKFLPTTLNNGDDFFELFNKLLAIGGSLDLVIASSGINADDYYDILKLEKLLEVKDLLELTENVYTSTGEEDSDENGRPESEDVEETGEETRDNDGNDR